MRVFCPVALEGALVLRQQVPKLLALLVRVGAQRHGRDNAGSLHLRQHLLHVPLALHALGLRRTESGEEVDERRIFVGATGRGEIETQESTARAPIHPHTCGHRGTGAARIGKSSKADARMRAMPATPNSAAAIITHARTSVRAQSSSAVSALCPDVCRCAVSLALTPISSGPSARGLDRPGGH